MTPITFWSKLAIDVRSQWRGPGWRVAVALVAGSSVLAASTAACRSEPPPPRPVVRIASAFATLTEALTADYRQSLPDIDIQSAEAPNSVDVIRALQADNADVGVAFSSDAYAGYWHHVVNNANKRELRGIALLQPLSQYLLVRADSGIHDVKDLRGRNIGVGPVYSSSAILGRLVTESFDLRPVTFTTINTRTEATTGLRNGTLDAVFVPGYDDPDHVMVSALGDGAYLVPISGPGVVRLTEDNPFVRLTTLPGSVISEQSGTIQSVGLEMTIVCAFDLPESVVYELTRQLFVSFPRGAGAKIAARYLNAVGAAATPIPLHPGAARYFRERGPSASP